MDEKLLKHGMISWHELLTTDPASARRFYSELLGWKWKEMPEMHYSTFEARGEEMGGLMERTPEMGEMPPQWGLYVTVDDVDASAKKAVQLGGRVVVEPTDIATVGRFCVIEDPQGAAISLIRYSAGQG